MNVYDMDMPDLESPDSLLTICAKIIVEKPYCLCAIKTGEFNHKLPESLGDLVADTFRKLKYDDPKVTSKDCEYFYDFFQPPFISLSKINFSELPISPETLFKFIVRYKYQLKEVNLINCHSIYTDEITILNQALCTDNPHLTSYVSKKTLEFARHRNRGHGIDLYMLIKTRCVMDTTKINNLLNRCGNSSNSSSGSNDSGGGRVGKSCHTSSNSNNSVEMYDNDHDSYTSRLAPSYQISDFLSSPSKIIKTSEELEQALSNPTKYHQLDNPLQQQQNQLTTSDNQKQKKITIKTLYLGKLKAESTNPHTPDHEDCDKPFRPKLDERFELKKLVFANFNGTYNNGVIKVSNMDWNYDVLNRTLHKTLEHLDVSCCHIVDSQFMEKFKSLKELILHECYVSPRDHFINSLLYFKQLQVLDLSIVVYENAPDDTLESINILTLLIELSDLRYLDVSGRIILDNDQAKIDEFENLARKQLEFLGLFKAQLLGNLRAHVKAKKVASESNEVELLNACEEFIYKPEMLRIALTELNHHYRSLSPDTTIAENALDIIMPILDKYMNDPYLVERATQSLWWIIKLKAASSTVQFKVRKAIISRCLDAMDRYRDNLSILFNGVYPLVLSPSIVSEYKRVASISLHMSQNLDFSVQGWGITLLNSLACQVNREQKEYLGRVKGIDAMKKIIDNKVELNNSDEILETAWSFLWNVTDEAPNNCERFIQIGGLNSFEKCMECFNDSAVLRNIMGLLGNVAEVPRLRKHFMFDKYIQKFYNLLLSEIDGIECSYNACGILAHIVAEGSNFWDQYSKLGILTLRRESILDKMDRTISQWPINKKRNINYRSLGPIIKLLALNIDEKAQYWAVWALTNLTRVSPSKYCKMLLEQGGIRELKLLQHKPNINENLRNLCEVCWYQVQLFLSTGHLNGIEKSRSIDLNELKTYPKSSSTDAASAAAVAAATDILDFSSEESFSQ